MKENLTAASPHKLNRQDRRRQNRLRNRRNSNQEIVTSPLTARYGVVMVSSSLRNRATVRTPEVHPADELLQQRLKACAEGDEDYWSFKNNARRELVHSYYQYPAMMVPQMLGQLIKTIKDTEGNIGKIYDPFVGSGTVLGETVSHGLDFIGQDINPLAVLVSRAKCGPYNDNELREAIARMVARISADVSNEIDVTFHNDEKWFFNNVCIALSRIRRSIIAEPELWVRRFLWVALAETVRLSSNSRTSTYKLHKRDDEDMERRRVNLQPEVQFALILEQNFEAFCAQRNLLQEENFLLVDGSYNGRIEVRHSDSSLPFETGDEGDQLSGLLVTSPPYGDNRTTVPYGQAAYLPLRWIDLADIDESITDKWLVSTQEIDAKSLGGSIKEAKARSESLRRVSPAFARIMSQLEKSNNSEFAKKVASFCADFYKCISPALSALRPGSPMVWVVGNRCVGGFSVPLDEILADFLREQGATEIITLTRSIHGKRMAGRNRSASTMEKEIILIWRKAR